MLHGRRLDHALEHVNGSRYALVHAVAKRARQITLWLTADPAELRAESAPPPVSGETVSRDPVALSEAEILDGEVIVHWDPDGRADEQELPDAALLETDPLLLEGFEGDEEEGDIDDETEALAPALAQAMETADADVVEVDEEADAEAEADADVADIDEASDEMLDTEDEELEIPLEEVDEEDEEDEPDA